MRSEESRCSFLSATKRLTSSNDYRSQEALRAQFWESRAIQEMAHSTAKTEDPMNRSRPAFLRLNLHLQAVLVADSMLLLGRDGFLSLRVFSARSAMSPGKRSQHLVTLGPLRPTQR